MAAQRAQKRPVIVCFPVAAALFAITISFALASEVRHLAPAGVSASLFPKPDRPVAGIVSPHRADEKERDAVDEFGQIARLLNLRAGMTVADIGAGSGYNTVRLARVVGPSGLVFAQDVTRKYLDQLAKRVAQLELHNVRLALGEPHDPRLPPMSVDMALLAHMYHEIDRPYAFLYNLAPTLRENARVGIVDFDRPTADHGTPPALLRCELAALGYRQIGFHQLTGDAGYLATFAPPSPMHRKPPAAFVPCNVRQ